MSFASPLTLLGVASVLAFILQYFILGIPSWHGFEIGYRRVAVKETLNYRLKSGEQFFKGVPRCRWDGDFKSLPLSDDRAKPEFNANTVMMLNFSLYLRESSRMGYVELVQKLLNEGADPDEPDSKGKTAVHYVAEGVRDEEAREVFRPLLYFHVHTLL
ncbi:hypothetical protein SUGI_0014730 [Cryptomeria japonica]|nr:hypothetical protein SUGI_0014730 [Cryptomeria japonica]